MSVDREDLEKVFFQSSSDEPGNITDALFYIAYALYAIRDELKHKNDLLEKKEASSWMEK